MSSALDADRLDYVQRDRLMSGTGTGAIDFTWLLEHARLRSGPIPGIEGLESDDVRTFAVDRRALQQAEIFLLARYQLYEQVYFHKVCRAFECMLISCLSKVAVLVANHDERHAGLPNENPIIQYFRTGNLQAYLALDDGVLNATLQQIARQASDGQYQLRELARNIVGRSMPCSINLEREAGTPGDYERFKDLALRLAREELQLEEGFDFFFDEPELSIYGKGEASKTDLHKRLWIGAGSNDLQEITDLSLVVSGYPADRRIGRLFFRDVTARNRIVELLGTERAKRRRENAARSG